MKRYSILMYNLNNYEIMREPMEIDQECEYIYVTDNPDLQKQTKVWKIVVEKDLEGLPAFDKCYKVRFNLFKYCSTNTCIYHLPNKFLKHHKRLLHSRYHLHKSILH